MNPLPLLAAAALALLPASPAPSAGKIAWRESLEDTLEAAAGEGKVVFLAVNMDGERANDRLAKDVYADKVIQTLATHTMNLVASNDSHAGENKTCPRFGTVTCRHHRQVDMAAREQVLKPDPQGYVIAPQHVFLGPDGKVILSVPYEIDAGELEWCFITALTTVDPDFAIKPSSRARAPRRLIMDGVYDAGGAGDAAPLTREQALELIDELKKIGRGAERNQGLRRLVTADEPEARKYLQQLLKSGFGGGRGGRRAAARQSENDPRGKLLHWIGVASPPSWWEVCAEFLDNSDEKLRREAVVALEQLAAPESRKTILSLLRKEKDVIQRKNLLRALGATGQDDKKARKLLLDQAEDPKEDEAVWRINAILALGSLMRHADIDEVLTASLTDELPAVVTAAALAIGITRDEAWLEPLGTAKDAAADDSVRTALEAAIAVIQGGKLSLLEEHVTKVAGDEIRRERVFGLDDANRE